MKYMEIGKTYFKAQLAWRFDIALNMLFTVSIILLAHVLWGAVFDGRELVGGLTLGEMLSYYVLVSFIGQLDMSDGNCGEFAARIRGGTFTGFMVHPVSTQLWFMAQSLGVSAFYLSFDLIAAAAWVWLFRIPMALTASPVLIGGAALMAAIGLVLMMQLNFFISILAFKFQEIGTFNMVKACILSLATGSFIPLMLLPPGVVSLLRFLPFYYVRYLPSMLLLGKNTEELGMGLAVLGAWTAFFTLLGKWTYSHMRVHYDGVGI